jgi:parallel beta-helix repeat protein
MILLMKRKEISEIVLMLILTGFLTPALNIKLAKAEPRTWTVDDDGPADFHTVQEAVNAAGSGDTIFVRNGTYYEHVVVGKSVSLIGESRKDTIIDGNYAGSPIKILADDVTVTSFMIQNSNITDLAAGSSSNKGILVDDDREGWLISENTIRNCALGIRTFWIARSGIIYGNVVENISLDGIMIGRYAENCSILNNVVNGSKHCGIHVWGWSENCLVSNNNVSNSFIGIDAIYCSGIDVFCNNIRNCVYGLYGADSYSPFYRFFHNNLINNTINAIDERSVDVWDDGYPSGGNYWSNYTGIDNYSGPYQNETGSDGIGDTPYIINSNNIDHYPLMNPYTPLHDIALIDIASSKTVVGQGYGTSINITIANQGDIPETFPIITYANKTIIQTNVLTLENNTSTTITFTWNTASFAYGNYTIWAYAMPILGETNTTDNAFTDGLVLVTVSGDVSGDCLCDMLDISILVDKFQAKPGDAQWDPNCDIQDDLIIDMADISIAIDHFLQEFTP